MVALEPKISLPEKFDGTRLKFRGFVSQVRLIMQLHPRRYFDDTTRVGFIRTLLTGTVAAWFAPILETSSALLQDFNAFMAEFEAVFGDSDKARIQLTNCVASSKGHVRPLSTPQNSGNLSRRQLGKSCLDLSILLWAL